MVSDDTIQARVASSLGLDPWQVQAATALFDDGATVPFVARYRKERTGELDEVQLRDVQKQIEDQRELEARRASILDSLAEQGVEDAELLGQIRQATERQRLEDLYAPYRPRRRTRAQRAREAGLTPVAEAIAQDKRGVQELALDHVCEDYDSADAVLAGARDILAERVADDAEIRAFLRDKLRTFGQVESKKKRGADEDERYETYLGFSTRIDRARPHQILAIRRGVEDDALSVKLAGEDDRWVREIQRSWIQVRDRGNRAHMEEAVEDGYQRLLFPKAERDLWSELEQRADAHAIDVFAVNLKNLLLQAPMPGRRVLGVDPGMRTGCKLAAVDETGDVLATSTIYVHDGRKKEAPRALADLIERHDLELVAVGNGTGSRQAQEAVAEALELLDTDREVRYAVVDEAGASVYSASEIAREELPEMDVSLRGAVSIARRLQDPLAELVKIDPRSIGVGMYQHDVDQAALQRALEAVIEDVVNAVGVDLNSASPALLAQVSGIGPTLASRTTDWRTEHGGFDRRAQLLEVHGIGAKTFEQAAGFLRIRQGTEPLDDTGIHPESYPLARALLEAAGASGPGPEAGAALDRLPRRELLAIARKHDAGEPTLEDILAALRAPGRDPRAELDAPQLRAKALSMEDLNPGMRLTGTVRNVVDFGAFVDVGVKQDGLVHVSEMADRYVKNPYDVVSVGDLVEVKVLEVDLDRGRISLSIKQA